MFLLSEVLEESKDIIGKCSTELFLKWSTDVVLMVSSQLDTEPFFGVIDICTTGCSCSGKGINCSRGHGCGRKCVTLPREVGTVLAVLINGHPTLGKAQNFQFHLNSSGVNCEPCDYSWEDLGRWHSTYRDLIVPAKVVAFSESVEDNNKLLVVFGYDSAGNVLRRNEGGKWLDGIRIPIIHGLAIPDDQQPFISRITAITKEETVGSIRLATTDSSGLTGVNLSVMEPDETIPQYRRIKLGRCADWVRVNYLKSNKKFISLHDHVPMLSRMAFLLGMNARKNYATLQLDQAHAFEADCLRHELSAQQKLEAPLYFPLQIVDRNQLKDRSDYDIR